MDAFFAAVEQQRHPELRGKPLVIGDSGDPTKMDLVSTASYEARKFGIYFKMPLKTARELCPHAIILPADHKEYERISERIKDILGKFCPIMEDASIDEAFLDISEMDKPEEEIAKEIKKMLLNETGLTCSIGIAPNKLLAKMASDMQKPDGITIIREGDLENCIWPLPVGRLLGVGPKTEQSLKEMGIGTIGNLVAIPLDKLVEKFGKSQGRYLYEASRGIDESPLITHRKTNSKF